jgi:hypothetical protein
MSDCTMSENPFRAGGEISKDADDIVDAFKNGKLSVISNSDGTREDIEDKDDEKRESLVQPLERKNGVIAVKTGTAVNTKNDKFGQEMFEDEKEKKPYCCVVL